MDNETCHVLANAIKTAALIIAVAMLSCSVIDYFTFRELPPLEDEHQEVYSIPL